MIVRFDSLNRFITPKVTLCNPCSRYINGEIDYSIGVVSDIKNFTMDYNFNAQSTGKFEYTDLTNTVEEENYKLHYKEIYSKLQEYRYLFIRDFGFCIITNVSETQTIVDGKKILTKTVSFSSCDKEFENYEVPIFTTDDVDTVTMTLQEVIDKITATYSNWTCDEADIDESLKTDSSGNAIYRTFQDISAENLYDFLFGADGSVEDAFDCIIDCDYIQRKLRFYSKDNYKKKYMTNIVLSDNLLKDLSFDSSSDELYSALSVEGDNGLNIRAVNPNGTNIIYNFDHFKKDGWMPSDLINKINTLEANINKVTEPVGTYPHLYPSLYTQLSTQLEIAQREYNNLVQEREAVRLKLESKKLAYTNAANDNSDTITKERALTQIQSEINNLTFGGLEPFNEIINLIVPVTDEQWKTDWKDNGQHGEEICFVRNKNKGIASFDNQTLEGLDQIQCIYTMVTSSEYKASYSDETLYYLDDSNINWDNMFFYFNPQQNRPSADPDGDPNSIECWFKANKEDLKLYLKPNPTQTDPPLHFQCVALIRLTSAYTDKAIQYFSNSTDNKDCFWDITKTLIDDEYIDNVKYTDISAFFCKLNLYRLVFGINNYGQNKQDGKADDVGEYSDDWIQGDVIEVEDKTEKTSQVTINGIIKQFDWYYKLLKLKDGDKTIGLRHKSKNIVIRDEAGQPFPGVETVSQWYFTDNVFSQNNTIDMSEDAGYIDKYIGVSNRCVSIHDLFIDETSTYSKKYPIYISSTHQIGLNYKQLKNYVSEINKLCSIGTNAKEIESISFDANSNIAINIDDNPIFTEDNIKRLYGYIRVGNYTNSDITVADNDNDEERVKQSEVLRQKGIAKLKDICENLKKISVTPKDFIFSKEFVGYSTQLESGAVIKIKPEKVLSDSDDSILEEYYLTNFSIDYDNKTLNMTFGNKLNRFDLKSLFDDVLGDVSKSSFQIRKLKQKIN